jgi:hypothetical protein
MSYSQIKGLGAGKLFGDTTLFPARGQTILIDPKPGYDRVAYIDCSGMLLSPPFCWSFSVLLRAVKRVTNEGSEQENKRVAKERGEREPIRARCKHSLKEVGEGRRGSKGVKESRRESQRAGGKNYLLIFLFNLCSYFTNMYSQTRHTSSLGKQIVC